MHYPNLHYLRSSIWILLIFSVLSVQAVPINSTETEISKSNELSPQSAFWSMVAIAFNTMADIPARIDDYPRDLTFFLKASPWICLFDVMFSAILVIRWMRSMGPGAGYEAAMAKLAERKFHTNDTIPDKFQTPRTAVRIMLFIFGALPQAIKLFVCKGIWYTQFMATCYLTSFIIDELILFHSRKRKISNTSSSSDSTTTELESGVNDDYTIWSSVVLGVGNEIRTFGKYQLKIISLIDKSKPIMITTAICIPTAGLLYWLQSRQLKEFRRVGREAILFLSPTLLALVFYMFETKWLDISQKVWLNIIFGLLLKASASVVMLYLPNMVIKMTCGDSEESWLTTFPLLAFSGMIWINFTSYFFVSYDSNGTFKPSWTDWLG